MYPAIVDLASITVNGRNGIGLQGEAAGDFSSFALAGGNIFNTSNSAVVIGAPFALAYKGRGYVAGGPLIASPGPTGIIPLSTGSSYFSYFFTFDGLTDEEICASMDVFDVDGDGVDDIFCGDYGGRTYGGGYWIKGGTALRSISSLNLNTINGNNGCRFTNFFSAGDGCGFSVKIAQNVTGNGKNAFVIACPNAFSNLGAVIVVPYTPNFCPGGTFTGTSLDGVKATYYKGTVVSAYLGYSLEAADIHYDGSQDLIMGSLSAGTYIKFGGSSVMGTPPILVSSVDKIITGQSGDSSGSVLGRLGDVFGNGYDNLLIGAPSASQWGLAGAGRIDILKGNSSVIAGPLSLPGGLTSTNGVTVFDTVAGEYLGSGGRALGDVNGDNRIDFSMVADGSSNFGRTNGGSVSVCYSGTIAFQSNNTAFYQNLIDGITCTEYRGGLAGDYTGIGNSINGILDWNGDGVRDWCVGASRDASQIGLTRIIFGDAPPRWITNTITIPDCGQTILGLGNLNATDPNHNSTTFIYNINVSNGNATLVSNPLNSITSFNYSQLISGQVKISNACNHFPLNYSVGVTTPGLAYLPSQPGTVNFIRIFPPVILNNNLKIGRGKSILVGLGNYNASSIYTFQDYMNLWFNFTGTHLTYKNAALNNNTVTGAKVKEIASNVIFATHDDSASAPVLNATVTDDSGLSSAPQATNVTFIDKPYLSVALPTLFQDGNARISNTNLDATCGIGCNPTNLQFSFSATGAYTARYPDLITPVPTFTKQDLLAVSPAGMYLVSDGTAVKPTSVISATDLVNGLFSGAASYPLPFVDAPYLSNNLLSAVENRTITVTKSQLDAFQQYNTSALGNIVVNASCQGGGFYSYPQGSMVSLFQNYNISNGDMGFSTNSGLPNCTVILSSDQGQAVSKPQRLNFNYHPAPKFGNVQFRIGQGVKNQLVSSSNIEILNLDGNPATYTLDILSPQHISYGLNATPNILTCTVEDLLQNRLSISDDDSIITPSTSFKVTDTYGLSDTKAALFTLVKKPQPVNATFPKLYQQGSGSSMLVTTDMLGATCDAPCTTNASSLVYDVDTRNAAFTLPDRVTESRRFSKQDLLNGQRYFVGDGSNNQPIVRYNLTDLPNNLVSGPFTLNTPFADTPTLTKNQLFSVRDRIRPVNGTQLWATQRYNSTSLDELALSASCQGGSFYSYPQNSLVSFFQNQNLSRGDIGFSTGNSGAPNCSVILSGSGATSSPLNLNFAYYSGPRLGTISLTVNQGETNKPVTSSSLPLENIVGDATSYRLDILSPQHISYGIGTNNNIQNCTAEDVLNNRLFYSTDGSIFPPSANFTITDAYGLSDTKAGQYTLIRLPQPLIDTIGPLYQVGSNSVIQVTTAMLDASCNVPCNTNASSLLYSVTGQYASFTLPDFTTPNNNFTKQAIINGNVYLKSGGTNNQPILSYTLTDLANSLSGGPYAMTIPFRDQPYFPTSPSLAMDQNTVKKVTASQIFARDNTNPSDSLSLTFPFATSVSFSSNTTGVLVPLYTPFTVPQSLITQGKLLIADDNTANPATSFGVQAGNAWLNSTVATVPVNLKIFNPPPVKVNAKLTVVQGTTPITITTGDINFIPASADIKTRYENILVKLSAVKGGYFQDTIQPGVPIFEYYQNRVLPAAAIQFVPDGTEPSFSVMAVTPTNVPNLEGPIAVSTAAGTLTYIPNTTPPNVDLCHFELVQGEPTPVTKKMLQLSSPYGNQGSLMPILTNFQHVEFGSNITGSYLPYANQDLVSFTMGEVSAGNVWAKQDGTFNNLGFYVAARDSKGLRSQAQPCFTKFISANYPPVMKIPGVGGLEQGGELFVTKAFLEASADNPSEHLDLRFNITITDQKACKFIDEYRRNTAIDSFEQRAIGQHLFLKHDGSTNKCTFNTTVIAPSGSIAGPFSSNVLLSLLPPETVSASTSLLSTNSIAAAFILAGITIPVTLFKWVLPYFLNKALEQEIHDPLELAIMKSLIDQLWITTLIKLFYMSKDKRTKYLTAIQRVIAELQDLGVATKKDIEGDKDKKDVKEDKDKKDIEGDKERMIIARAVVKTIKLKLIPKRSTCTRCFDRGCRCERDIEDDKIYENAAAIAKGVVEILKIDKPTLITGGVKPTDMPSLLKRVEVLESIVIPNKDQQGDERRPLLLLSSAATEIAVRHSSRSDKKDEKEQKESAVLNALGVAIEMVPPPPAALVFSASSSSSSSVSVFVGVSNPDENPGSSAALPSGM